MEGPELIGKALVEDCKDVSTSSGLGPCLDPDKVLEPKELTRDRGTHDPKGTFSSSF